MIFTSIAAAVFIGVSVDAVRKCFNRNQAHPSTQSRSAKTTLGDVPREVIYQEILSYLSGVDITNMSVANIRIKNELSDTKHHKFYWDYCLKYKFFKLDLDKFNDVDILITVLGQLKNIKHLKIKKHFLYERDRADIWSLNQHHFFDNSRAKLTLFINAINNLGDTFRFDNLSHLNLSFDGLSSDNFLMLNNGFLRRTRSLTSLDLLNNRIGDAGASAIANSPHMQNLTSLRLFNNRIEDAGASAIANSPHIQYLTSLYLKRNYIRDAGARAIANSAHMQNLTLLRLDSNRIGDAGASALADSAHMNKLTSLDVSYNKIGDAGASAIADSAHLQNLTSLYFFGYFIRKDVRQLIIDRFPNISISRERGVIENWLGLGTVDPYSF